MALHAKAKAEPGFRFYALYDKIYREDMLAHAYACCRANKGAAGVDGQTFEDIEAYGVERWLGELAQALREESYRPEAVRRVYIPKPNGKLRPLGIPILRDRVCEMAARLVLEPIFEADLPSEQHAYRPGRNALSAVREVHGLLNAGYRDIVDADLSGYFDSIPHEELLKSVARRVVDRRMLHLVKMWLESPVEESDERGRKKRTTQNRDNRQGIPQGSPISPLLANLYMRRFVLGWKKVGLERRLGAKIVNYADDLVICCRRGADEALTAMRGIIGRLKLTVNEEKTRVCRVPESSFDFLGYTFGRYYSVQTGRAYLGTRPSQKSIKRLIESIRVQTDRNMLLLEATQVVERLNRMLMGWANYFCLGPVSKAYRTIDAYTTARLRRWLCRKHKGGTRGHARYPDEYLYERLALVCLPKLTRNLPWAKA
ncbi:MAG: group II intron reverse transcriptase/maturase [Desulfomonile tiedjei]|nr:group II intron reverse transcriptase/maturase [Desulfomonile tiedjei]